MQFSRKHRLQAGTPLVLVAGIALATAPAQAQVNAFNFFKVGNYNQTGAATQTLGSYNLTSTVFAQNATDATAATLTPGAGTTVPYTYMAAPPPPETTGYFNYFSPSYASQADLDAAFPQGTYTVNYSGGTETPGSFNVNYSADAYAASTPLFTPATFTGLQNLNASQAFTLDWNLDTPSAAANDPLNFLEIYDPSTGNDVYDASFLGPNITSATLGANTLLPNTSYMARLIFDGRIDGPSADVTDSNSNNIFVTQAFELNNYVSFKTAPAVPEPAPLALLSLSLLPLGLWAAKRRRAA